MTAYIVITDPETDPDAPLTSELAKKWRDNPLAMFEGDATAVAAGSTLKLGALDRLAVGTSIRIRSDATQNQGTILSDLGFLQAGTIRVTCQYRTTSGGTTAIFRVARKRAGTTTNFDASTTSTSFIVGSTDVTIQPGDAISVILVRSGISDVEIAFTRIQVATGQLVYPGPNMQGILENPAI